MTDGMIQEVFKSITHKYFNSGISIHKRVFSIHEITTLQQELIEKIKQLTKERDMMGEYYHNQYYFRKLIGDNE